MGDEKVDPERIRRILSLVFAQNPIAHDAIIYRFGLEGPKGRMLDSERSFSDLAILLGLDGTEGAEEIINHALRRLRAP